MTQRRMFSLDVVGTKEFLEMPGSSQCLYFHLGMRADNDGFVSSPKKIIKRISCTQDDLNMLISKGYITPFNSGGVVLAHWKIHNDIPSGSRKKTQ